MFIKPSIEEMKRTREFLKVEGILDRGVESPPTGDHKVCPHHDWDASSGLGDEIGLDRLKIFPSFGVSFRARELDHLLFPKKAHSVSMAQIHR